MPFEELRGHISKEMLLILTQSKLSQKRKNHAKFWAFMSSNKAIHTWEFIFVINAREKQNFYPTSIISIRLLKV